MSLVLSPELEEAVEARLESGRYRSAEEVLREALRLLALKEFQARLDESIAQAERGETVDGEEFMARMIAELDAEIEAEERVKP
jgi:antitoxin ParD1/3/4